MDGSSNFDLGTVFQECNPAGRGPAGTANSHPALSRPYFACANRCCQWKIQEVGLK